MRSWPGCAAGVVWALRWGPGEQGESGSPGQRVGGEGGDRDRARGAARSHAASPPKATVNPRSSTILPGSCTANGRRHVRHQAKSSLASPLRRAASASSAPLACETSNSPPAITNNHGRQLYPSLAKCLSVRSIRILSNSDSTPRVAPKIDYSESARLVDEWEHFPPDAGAVFVPVLFVLCLTATIIAGNPVE